MGSVVMAHLIGTVSLLVIFTVVGTYFTIYYSSLRSEVIASNLQDAADYVSSQIVDLVNLCFTSTEDQLLIKELEIPQQVGGSVYIIKIAYSEDLVKIVAYFFSNPSILGESLLPWSTGGNIEFFNGTDPGISDPRVKPRTSISSLHENLIVWCLKKEGRITFGLGVMEA